MPCYKRDFRVRGYPRNLVEKLLPEIKFTSGGSALKGNNKTQKDILPFVTQYQPSVSNLKGALLKKWHLRWRRIVIRVHLARASTHYPREFSNCS